MPLLNKSSPQTELPPSEPGGYYQIALLVALSCVLQISESMIPHPVPGLRLGLANMITLLALVMLGFRPALEIALLRTVLSSLIIGTFMSPTFILSLAGAIISTLVMGILFRISRLRFRYGFSIIGISIAGALTHNMVQLALAYLLLVRHTGVFVFFPFLCYGAVGMGWITGIAAAGVCRRLDEKTVTHDILLNQDKTAESSFSSSYQPDTSFLYRLSPEMKLIGIIFLSLIILIFNSFSLFIGLSFFLLVLMLHSRISPGFLFSKIRRYKVLILMAFILPLFFSGGGHTAYDLGFFKISQEGLNTGILFSLRILFLILFSAILMRTTSPEEMTRGLTRVLSPLKYIGISEKRTARILTLSWAAIPIIWETARHAIRQTNFSKASEIRSLIPLLSSLIAGLYMNTNPESPLWKRVRSEKADVDHPPETITPDG
jgi:heptaprenyl diphosphate synthase